MSPLKKKVNKLPSKKALPFYLAALLIFGALWWLLSNKTLYAPDKNDIKKSAQTILDLVQAQTSPVYENFSDAGCVGSTGGLLGYSYDCSFNAKKYFKAKGSGVEILQALQDKLAKEGLTPDAEIKLTAEGPETLRYQSAKLFVFLQTFKPDGRAMTARDYLYLPNDIQLSEDEYLYGVEITATYWSCSGQSWFEAPCPAPPSPVRNSKI